MDSLASDIAASLRAMDEEATTTRNGLRTGLVDHAGHAGVHQPPWEPPVYKGLAEHLRQRGHGVETDVAYPGASGLECDLLVRSRPDLVCWLEVKLLWKEWISTVTGGVRCGDFDSYLLGPGPGRLGRSHSLAQDFEKLAAIEPWDGTHLAVLGIVFDSVDNSADPLMERMEREQQLAARLWRRQVQQRWSDHNSPRHRIGVWIWSKPISRVPNQAAFEFPEPGREDGPSPLKRLQDFPRFEARSKALLQKYASLGTSGWLWEDWVAESLELGRSDEAVARIGQRIRDEESPYRRENYHRPERVERLIVYLYDQAKRELQRRGEQA